MNNVSYIESLYREWMRDPAGVEPAWDAYFRQLTGDSGSGRVPPPSASKAFAGEMVYKQSRVDSLLWAYRDIGYLYARLNPLGGDYGPEHDYLLREGAVKYEKPAIEEFGLSAADLSLSFSAGQAMKPSPAPLREILDAFQETYCGTLGVEFLHIQDKRIRRWLITKMESSRNRPSLDAVQKRIILTDLLRTEALEKSLSTFFVGQKRFSLEGSEAIIPALHFMVDSAARFGIEEFVIGSTHRGRLSILNTILHMTPEDIFSTFHDDGQPKKFGGVGDVKYHIGYEAVHTLDPGGQVRISMCANASHLESIDSVVEGKTRALQDHTRDAERKKVVPILLHGDAAFCGQGVVAETFNLSRLEGYSTRGTIHLVINNQVGFTTSSRSARSSVFPTDTAKAFGIPVFHVNGDDPEAAVYAANLALEFRQTFGVDCVLDIFCFRRHGHNETDEPSFSHPQMYKRISRHPGVASLYGAQCVQSGAAGQEEQETLAAGFAESMKAAFHRFKSGQVFALEPRQGPAWAGLGGRYCHEHADTRVEESVLRSIARHITTPPENFHLHPALDRILKQQRKLFDEEASFKWSFAESLAFGSLLLEGFPVRLSGEDCVRGTFSQRHLTWWDTESERPLPYTPLKTLGADQAALSAFDSPLSEYSIVGFEYGYSLVNPFALVAWEAQFGDFANGAQVIIDNYIASGRTKWNQASGLVLLLPHGIEGQGPDHSNAYLDRYLKLASDDNIQICNATTPAQYFHLLRRQVKLSFRTPLILMTPKSLLRHPKVISPLGELTGGGFREVLDDACDPAGVKRIALCSGKIYYDLIEYRDEKEIRDTAVIRVEQLYPFPLQPLRECLEKYPSAGQVLWVQEESRNTGAWSFMNDCFSTHFPSLKLSYFGRDECAGTATGSVTRYQIEQTRIVESVFDTGTA
jgi:2-oxoglutarate dehydrogenase E1 component